MGYDDLALLWFLSERFLRHTLVRFGPAVVFVGEIPQTESQ